MQTFKTWYRWSLQQGQKVYKVSKQCRHFGRRYDVMLDNLWRHNSIYRNDFISKLSQFTFLYRSYLLIKFHDDQRSRSCWTKSPSFQIGLVRRHDLITKSRLHIKLSRVVNPIKTHILCEIWKFLHTLLHLL